MLSDVQQTSAVSVPKITRSPSLKGSWTLGTAGVPCRLKGSENSAGKWSALKVDAS